MIYDVIVIGSSPVFLLEAIYRSKRGHKVLVIEQDEKLGGAWSSISKFGFTIDNGPHLIYNKAFTRRLFNFLKNDLKISFSYMKPRPKGDLKFLLWDSPELSFLNTEDLKKIKVFIRYFLYSVINNVLKLSDIIFKTNYTDYLFPSKGTFNFINKLEAQLLKNDITVIKNFKVNKILFEKHLVTVSAHNKTFNAKTIFSTSRINVKQILINNTPFVFPFKKSEVIIIYLLIRDMSVNKFSYYKFNNHSDFFIAADLSETTSKSLPQNNRIISCLLNKHVPYDQKIYLKFFSLLKDKNLIGTRSEILEKSNKKITSLQRNRNQINDINKLISESCFYYCDNLAEGMIERFKNFIANK